MISKFANLLIIKGRGCRPCRAEVSAFMFPAPTWSGLGFILLPRWGGCLEPESLNLFFRPVGADGEMASVLAPTVLLRQGF